mmetsp:Transcript_14186/g.41787  ORF Transcript_14186/g.41787 Transcript_14186/m.41787 type:complete len:212 (-) Transcript_14186:1076-1711(-)
MGSCIPPKAPRGLPATVSAAPCASHASGVLLQRVLPAVGVAHLVHLRHHHPLHALHGDKSILRELVSFAGLLRAVHWHLCSDEPRGYEARCCDGGCQRGRDRLLLRLVQHRWCVECTLGPPHVQTVLQEAVGHPGSCQVQHESSPAAECLPLLFPPRWPRQLPCNILHQQVQSAVASAPGHCSWHLRPLLALANCAPDSPGISRLVRLHTA